MEIKMKMTTTHKATLCIAYGYICLEGMKMAGRNKFLCRNGQF